MPDQNKAPLAEAVERHHQAGFISFHMPGHKGCAEQYPHAEQLLGQAVFDSDLTELAGLDALHAPAGVIREAEQLAADLFGAERSWFLVNGTTSGIVAALAAAGNADGVILTERACHSSVTSGFVLSGATPYYLEEQYDEEAGIMAGVSTETLEYAFANCSGVQAVVLTHPSYYGTYSDLRGIVRIAHAHGVPVIVDEAHGAQLMFTGQGIPSSMECGADIAIQSTHKMLGSLTQTAMLHLQGSLIDARRLQHCINMVTSTSPSYPLMISLDSTRKRMAAEGRQVWDANRRRAEQAEQAIRRIPGMRCTTGFRGADGTVRSIEKSRLLIDALPLGLSGTELEAILREQFRIEAEFSDSMRVILLLGSGTSDEHMARLIQALKSISAGRAADGSSGREAALRKSAGELFRLPVYVEITPRDAVTAPLEILHPEEAEGAVSAADVAVYPPGIPVLRPGERITRDILDYILRAKEAGLSVHGLIESESGFLLATAQDRQKAMIWNGYF